MISGRGAKSNSTRCGAAQMQRKEASAVKKKMKKVGWFTKMLGKLRANRNLRTRDKWCSGSGGEKLSLERDMRMRKTKARANNDDKKTVGGPVNCWLLIVQKHGFTQNDSRPRRRGMRKGEKTNHHRSLPVE